MNKKKNIVHVINTSFAIPYFLGEQLNYFRDKGYDESIICHHSNDLKALSEKYHFDYMETSITRKMSIKEDFISIINAYKFIRKKKADIVVGHTPKGAMIAMIASLMAGVPIRLFFRHGLIYETCHGLKKSILISIERITSLCSTKVVCVSPYLIERSMDDRLSTRSKMTLLNIGSCNGVDAKVQFNPDRNKDPHILRGKLNIPHNAFVVGYAGRLVKDKGIEELVKAFSSLQKKKENIYLLLVGPEENKDALSKETHHMIHSHNNIITTGLIKAHIEDYYNIMNVLVLPTHREGLGTCILEASSMRVPVLTTSHTGSRDAIVNNETGLYIDMNPQSIEEKLTFLIDNPKTCKKMGENGRNFILKNFGQETIWQEIEKLYE